MRLPALIIASAGNGYQVLYKSKAFDSLNPRDFHEVCLRMDSVRFERQYSFFTTQSLGKMVIGKVTNISRPEFGVRTIKVTHCYFMNMSNFIDIVRGYRRQGAVINTFKDHVRQDFDSTVEEVTFVKRPFAEQAMTVKEIADAVIALGMVNGRSKFMFGDIDPANAMKVLFGYFPANFICDISALTSGEAGTNDFNVLFGMMNVISDNRIISVHAAAQKLFNISDEITAFVMSEFKNAIVEIMEHVDRFENGYLTELVSTTRIINEFEQSGIINAASIMKLMDKASTIEGKMAIYGIVLEVRNKIRDAQVVNTDILEKYWAYVTYTSIIDNEKKNAALVNNICANHQIIDRDNYLAYLKQVIVMKHEEISDENLAMLILIAHEREYDKTRLINNRYDATMAKQFMGRKLNLGARREAIEDKIYEMIFS